MQYDTIAEPVDTELEISRSRFLTRLVRVSTEDDARRVIAEVKALHPKARHHCTAFVLGSRQEIQRSNDDGEPSGTAGAPMLDALLAAGLSDVVAVVTRYFGGVLLGAGGLTRAYRAAVAQATAHATRVTRAQRCRVQITAPYDIAPPIEAELRRRGVAVLESEYTEAVTLNVAAANDQVEAVVALAAEMSAGSAAVTVGETEFVDVSA